ncbi:MAG: molybdopterin-synthase adenylyltransferase MoeB [Lysobacterales bacterium]
MSKPVPDDGCILSPDVAYARVKHGARLIDVREPAEFAMGAADGSENVPLALLETRIAAEKESRPTEIIAICATGKRSLAAATLLQERGFRRAASVAGGFNAWRLAGLPETEVALDADSRERYARQLVLPEIGIEGQRRLRAARVLIVGAGGLGSPVALYLAAAGVGTLRIVDPDRVDRSNLHRQVLHRDVDVDAAKVTSAKRALLALNPQTRVEAIEAALGTDNATLLARDADVLIDGSDNFVARHHVNAASIELGKPLVYGAVHRFEGQASVFWPARPGTPGPCYRCLFPESPPPEFAPNCATAGVLGVVPGIIGLVQATETLKLLLGFGETLCGRLLTFDARSMRFREIAIPRDPECPACV